jgi:hypothetical protein
MVTDLSTEELLGYPANAEKGGTLAIIFKMTQDVVRPTFNDYPIEQVRGSLQMIGFAGGKYSEGEARL